MAYHHGRLRESAIEAALEQIEAQGEASLTLRGLARELGVTSAALYRHFADREALLDAVATEGRRQLRETLEESVNWAVNPKNSKDAGHRMETVVHHQLSFAERRPRLFHLMISRPASEDREDTTFLKRAIEDLAAINRKVKNPQPPLIHLAQSLIDGAALRYAEGTAADLEEELIGKSLMRILS